MADFQILPWSFSDTEATIVACNDAAKQQICGGISATCLLSNLPALCASLKLDGFTIEFV